MKMYLSAIFGLVVTGLAFWIVTSDVTSPAHLLPMLLLALVFVVPPFGSFWMLFMVIRYEKHPMPWVLIAFIPYFFLGYYYERVRGGKLGPAHAHASNNERPNPD